ncbi:DUF1993 domain-containing protein [Bacteriovorax stolpii]|uniref:DUF1993 domain-containing protein n=1 Tax=Bacteriovorax stolpii TaxID=960 RepID=A0A2K9NPR3_BACTC|nr:DUF1993 domain-containing protein [Bacteriovorax stolpii]AUN97499.1 DUF1993 domain-containing protein [Bacteriovorax stolpii]QDK42529.1 DUF1993 domain-containing protein [Bacteriovorax stolpii]TDP52678.1 hypothetical protein C8D79_2444 [Bacteriovorax stolpii]BDT27614.1 DUF1993 domain-containing protein [Bacteriovorax sp. HI3]
MIFELTVPQFIKTLKNLNGFLDKAAGYADSKKFEMDVLLNSRLAPDQFPLTRQIQIVCDTAKLGVSRLTGKSAPVNDDTEKTLAEVKARIQGTIAYLESMKPEDFKNAATATITTPRWEGKTLTGNDYVIHHVIPNFYFHVTTAYAIMRHNGVDLGKKDFLGEIPYKLP